MSKKEIIFSPTYIRQRNNAMRNSVLVRGNSLPDTIKYFGAIQDKIETLEDSAQPEYHKPKNIPRLCKHFSAIIVKQHIIFIHETTDKIYVLGLFSQKQEYQTQKHLGSLDGKYEKLGADKFTQLLDKNIKRAKTRAKQKGSDSQ